MYFYFLLDMFTLLLISIDGVAFYVFMIMWCVEIQIKFNLFFRIYSVRKISHLKDQNGLFQKKFETPLLIGYKWKFPGGGVKVVGIPGEGGGLKFEEKVWTSKEVNAKK